ncbi:MAG: hypothetical protein M1155_01260 [Patescibacteria group bacterium]|nr:hypothetical protein [Patescibacteria group bacterium]
MITKQNVKKTLIISVLIFSIITITAITIPIFEKNHRADTSLPTITINSPTTNDIWTTDSTHAITWTTKDLPTKNKISVTLRRIPPPPLQAEGQEFDPILFINLENTGSVNWNIGDNYPEGTYILGINSYASIPVTSPISTESAPFQITRIHLLNSDLYPIYSGISWGTEESATTTMRTKTDEFPINGYKITSQTINNITNIAAITTPFEKYYREKLLAAGWRQNIYMEAGGPGSSIEGYSKGKSVITIEFDSVFTVKNPNEPEQCPCNTTLSIFSGSY